MLFGLSPSPLRLILTPMLVSLGTGVLLAKFFPEARGSGVPQTKTAFHLDNGQIRPIVPLGKFLTGVLCVGSGHSMGREGPSVQIGAGLASTIGQWFRLDPERVRNLVPVGAAAALAAAFNTPVAAVLFALEEIIGDLNAGLIGSTVVASVTAVIVERSILGDEVLFRVPSYELVHPMELLAYAALGVVGGLISLLFCKGLLRLRAFFLNLPHKTIMLQPALGGLIVGIVLVFVPQVMGVGYEYVDQALNGGMLLQMMLLLCAVKLVATIISYASGNAGGIFAPSLYLGAMAGGVVGMVVNQWAPFPTGAPGAYALVGMGTLFAGIIRAPMTSVFMIFELTQDYKILVPLMIANMLSFVISRRFQPKPVYHALLEQNHVHLPETDARARSSWRAKDIMTPNVDFLAERLPIEQAWQAVREKQTARYLVGAADRLVGSIDRKTIEHALQSGHGGDPVGAFVSPNMNYLHPDQPLELALERFDPSDGIVPVLSRKDGRRVEGVITIDTILQFIHKRPA
ncbi:MAG TPA: chloride channel protein, partial [Terriglobia bacterium]|nr:chloride channel protein [Terriglobia bacterium]